MCTEEFIGKLEVDVKQFKKEMPTISKKLESLWKKSKIKVDRTEDPRLSATPIEKTALTSIHFDIAAATIERRRMYSEHLSDDLTIRHMDLSGTMQEQQDRLKHQLSREWSYLDAKDCVDKFGAVSVTPGIVMVMESIPCILHMEMRVGIKILTILFQVGLMNAKKQPTGLDSQNAKDVLEEEMRCVHQARRSNNQQRDPRHNRSLLSMGGAHGQENKDHHRGLHEEWANPQVYQVHRPAN